MGLCSWACTIAPIEVGARLDMLNGFVDIYEVHRSKQRECVEGSIQEAGVGLPPAIACKGTSLTVLQARNDWTRSA